MELIDYIICGVSLYLLIGTLRTIYLFYSWRIDGNFIEAFYNTFLWVIDLGVWIEIKIIKLIQWFLAPECELCKDTGYLHYLNKNGKFEMRPCQYCKAYELKN